MSSLLLSVCCLFAIFTFLTYDGVDDSYLYWLTATFIVEFAYLIAIMFGDQGSFVFDPNGDNWKRKTE